MTGTISAAPAAPPPVPHVRPRFILLRSVFRGVLFGLAVCGAVMLFRIFVEDNLRVVVPGLVYRSSQLSEARLAEVARKLGIRTVFNLRGFCAGQDWYAEESRTCARLGLSMEDFALAAGHLPTVSEMHQLVEALDRCEYPILFHCFRGVDRTGMASVLVLLLKTNTPLSEARRELALRHIHLPFGRTGNLDRFFDFYEKWLASRGWTHSPQYFRHWLLHEYHGGANTGRMELLGTVFLGADREKIPGPVGGPPPEPNGSLSLRLPNDVPAGLPVRVHNTSDETWTLHPSDNTGMHAFLRVLDEQGVQLCITRAGRFHAHVKPGEHIDLILVLPALPCGKYLVQIGMVEEQHCYFQEVGMDLLNLELEVS